MTSVPYPTFVKDRPVDTTNNRAALSAVGRCRINPDLTCGEAYRAIVAKNIEQATVIVDGASKDENKKLKKKFMKEGVAMAKDLIINQLQLDVSVIDVDVVVSPRDLISTDGCLAACLLDAGCSAIVTDGMNLEAMDAAKIPRERLVAHFLYQNIKEAEGNVDSNLMVLFKSVTSLASAVSVELSDSANVTVENLVEIFEKAETIEDQGVSAQIPSSSMEEPDLETFVKDVSSKAPKGVISLVDPTARQLGLSYAACMKTDRLDKLYTTVVCTRNGEALGLVYSSKESIVAALECGRGVYYSRSRNQLWRKGDSSGHFQVLHRLDVDCDGDALRFTVTQKGEDQAAFCHLNTLTCWGKPRGILHLQETLQDRFKSAPEGSYTKRLFNDPELLREKLVEEAQELSEATDANDVAEELADVMYFAMVRAVAAGVTFDDAVAELDKRSRKVTRRQGDSKAFRMEAAKQILEKKDGSSQAS